MDRAPTGALDVVAGVLEQGGLVLICQRKRTARHGGKWEFPGGKVEPGETGAAALRRELSEELGIETAAGRVLWISRHQYPERRPLAVTFFLVPTWRGTITNRVFETVCWRPLAALPEVDFLEADREFVNRLASGAICISAGVR
jgi:8-oxo-dGTP diphosphatase